MLTGPIDSFLLLIGVTASFLNLIGFKSTGCYLYGLKLKLLSTFLYTVSIICYLLARYSKFGCLSYYFSSCSTNYLRFDGGGLSVILDLVSSSIFVISYLKKFYVVLPLKFIDLSLVSLICLILRALTVLFLFDFLTLAEVFGNSWSF